jgi:hypothetical protein
MRRLAAGALALCIATGAMAAQGTHGTPAAHSFGVIGQVVARDGEPGLELALSDTSGKDLSFVVVNGIKGKTETCSDTLYVARRELLAQASGALVAVPAAADWSECRNSAGRPAAIERLTRLRELFYTSPMALGTRKLALVRQSGSGKFRSYAENAHWSVGGVLYAAVNLPANNNNYRAEAGRNSEYEDRLVANRFWLKRLFAHAARSNAHGVVLFSEGDIKAQTYETGLRALLTRSNPQDGFAEVRKQVATLAGKYEGKVLLVDAGMPAKGAEPAITWRGNLGHLGVGANTVEVKVLPGAENMFSLRAAGN